MTGKIVNLRQARKRRQRGEAAEKADANAARHGLTAGQKSLAKARADKARRELDAHERDKT